MFPIECPQVFRFSFFHFTWRNITLAAHLRVQYEETIHPRLADAREPKSDCAVRVESQEEVAAHIGRPDRHFSRRSYDFGQIIGSNLCIIGEQ